MQTTNLYQDFRMFLNAGDVIMIEWLYKEFLPLYMYTGKNHYLKINYGVMDELYGAVD